MEADQSKITDYYVASKDVGCQTTDNPLNNTDNAWYQMDANSEKILPDEHWGVYWKNMATGEITPNPPKIFWLCVREGQVPILQEPLKQIAEGVIEEGAKEVRYQTDDRIRSWYQRRNGNWVEELNINLGDSPQYNPASPEYDPESPLSDDSDGMGDAPMQDVSDASDAPEDPLTE